MKNFENHPTTRITNPSKDGENRKIVSDKGNIN